MTNPWKLFVLMVFMAMATKKISLLQMENITKWMFFSMYKPTRSFNRARRQLKKFVHLAHRLRIGEKRFYFKRRTDSEAFFLMAKDFRNLHAIVAHPVYKNGKKQYYVIKTRIDDPGMWIHRLFLTRKFK